MKSTLFVVSLMMFAIPTWAKDIPREFQGKWVGEWNKTLTPKHVHWYCQKWQHNDHDGAIRLTITAQSLQYGYWQGSETLNPLHFSQYRPHHIAGTAKLTTEDEEIASLSSARSVVVQGKAIPLNQRAFKLLIKNNVLNETIEWYMSDEDGSADNPVQATVQKQAYYRCPSFQAA